MSVDLPQPGEDPWGDKLNAAIVDLDQDLQDTKAKKGQPSGYAELDGTGKVPSAQLPAQTGGGVTAHSALTGLSADDHPQYLTKARGDALYAGGGGGSGGGTASRYVPVFIFNGESNSGGMAQNALATPEELGPRPMVQIWDNAANLSFQTLDIDVNNLIGHPAIPQNGNYHGWELELANQVEMGQWLDDTVYLVKTGQGASTIAEWAVGGSYWNTFLTRTRGAMALLRAEGKIPLVYFWWTLGLNDWVGLQTPVATWKPAVIAHFKKVRAELGYIPIFCTTYMAEANMGPSGYVEALNEIAAADNMVHIVDAAGCTVIQPPNGGHTYHWDYDGMKLLCDRMGSASRNFGQKEGYENRRIDRMAGTVASAPPAGDLPALVRTPATLSFMEGTAGGTFTLALSKAPTASVTVTVGTSGGNVVPTPSTLTFTTGNWSTAQTVTCTSSDDGAQNGTRTSTVTCSSAGVNAPVTVTVTVTDAYVPPVAGSPANTALPTISGNTTLGAVLTSTSGTWTNSPTSYAYQWKRDGTDIALQTVATHTIVAADQGHALTCRVTATNATGSNTATTASLAIPAAPVAPPGAVIWGTMAGAHASGNKIMCDMASGNFLYGGVTADPVTIDLTQPWEVITLLESDATSETTMTFIDDDIGANPFDWYNANGVVCWYKDAGVWHFPNVGLTDVALTPPPGLSYPCRIKMAKSGNDVTIAFGAGSTGPFDAPWATRTGVLAGRTTGYLKIDFAIPAVTKTVSVWATGATGAPVPLNTALPTITGTTTLGGTLTCVQGTWTNSPTSYTYQWRRDGISIAGETTTQHVIVAADQGTSLTCAETAINADGSGTAISAAVVVPGGASNWTPVTYQDTVGCSASGGTLTFSASSTPAGANIVGTVDATQPFEFMIEWPSNVLDSESVILILDTVYTTNMDYITTGPYVSSLFQFQTNLYAGTSGGSGGGTYLTTGTSVALPIKIRMSKSGNDVKYETSTNGTTWTAKYTHVGVLAGKTTLYPRVLGAGPHSGQNVKISRNVGLGRRVA